MSQARIHSSKKPINDISLNDFKGNIMVNINGKSMIQFNDVTVSPGTYGLQFKADNFNFARFSTEVEKIYKQLFPLQKLDFSQFSCVNSYGDIRMKLNEEYASVDKNFDASKKSKVHIISTCSIVIYKGKAYLRFNVKKLKFVELFQVDSSELDFLPSDDDTDIDMDGCDYWSMNE